MNQNEIEIFEKAKQEFLTTSYSATKVAEKYGICRLKFGKYLRANKIETSNKHRNFDEQFYISLYNEYKQTDISIAELAKKHNISKSFLGKFFREQGVEKVVTKSKYQVNSNFFNEIDNEEKAYWLGFLYADGYNSNTYVQLAISYIDYNHVKKFRKSLCSTHPIRYEKSDNTCRISISDKTLSNGLNRAGCIRNKTYCGKFPGRIIIPGYLLRHFIRGFFDGDGCINKLIIQELTSANSIQRKIDKVVFTIKLENFSLDLIQAIKTVCNVEAMLYYYEPLNRYEVYIQGQDNIRKFLDCIYKESTIYLDRKYAQYLYYILPSDLEIDQIISEKLSGNVLPDFEYDCKIN